MDRFKKYILPFLALGSIVSLAVVFRSFFMTNLVEPVAYLLWAVWGIVCSVNQNFYWMMLIIVCLLLMIRLIPPDTSNTPSRAYTYKHSWPNPVEYWQTLIQDGTLGRNEAEHLRDGLKKLLEAVIAQVERSDPQSSDEIPVIGKVPLSAAAQRFLFSSKGQSGMYSESRRFGILYFAPKWIRIWAGKFIRQDMTLIDEILERMETEMEISHD